MRDLDAMQAFYSDVLGLTLWRRFGDNMTFYKLAERADGRAQVLALFVDRWPSNVPGHGWAGHDPTRTTLHHYAFGVSLAELGRAATLLRAADVAAEERTFPWVGWRSLMLQDPENNVIELVAEDASVFVPDEG